MSITERDFCPKCGVMMAVGAKHRRVRYEITDAGREVLRQLRASELIPEERGRGS